MYGIFGYMACYCRNRIEEGSVQMFLNKFEVLKSKEMQKGEGKGKEMREDRKEILKEKKQRRERRYEKEK